jgi:transcriptional regulator with XRE-family HTH domain
MDRIDTRWFVDTLAERRLSQRGVARHLGCDPSQVHRLLTGKRTMRLDEAEQLAILLGKPVTEVLDRAGQKEGRARRSALYRLRLRCRLDDRFPDRITRRTAAGSSGQESGDEGPPRNAGNPDSG